MNGYGHINGAGPSAQPDTSGNVLVPLGPTNQPKVLVRSLTDNEAVFHLSGTELGYANSVRRVIMADVPTISEWTHRLHHMSNIRSKNDSGDIKSEVDKG